MWDLDETPEMHLGLVCAYNLSDLNFSAAYAWKYNLFCFNAYMISK